MRPGGFDLGALGNALVVAEHHRADRILLEIQRESEDVAGEFQHFAVTRVGEPVDAHDAIGDAHHRADIAGFGGGLELVDARLDEVADFRCLDGHNLNPLANTGRLRRQLERDALEPTEQGTVDYRVAGAQHGAADQCGIRGAVQAHRALELALQSLGKRLLLSGCRSARRRSRSRR